MIVVLSETMCVDRNQVIEVELHHTYCQPATKKICWMRKAIKRAADTLQDHTNENNSIRIVKDSQFGVWVKLGLSEQCLYIGATYLPTHVVLQTCSVINLRRCSPSGNQRWFNTRLGEKLLCWETLMQEQQTKTFYFRVGTSSSNYLQITKGDAHPDSQ